MNVARERSTLHQEIERALDRAARAQEDSRALVVECERVTGVLRETVAATHRHRNDRAMAGAPRSIGSETDS